MLLFYGQTGPLTETTASEEALIDNSAAAGVLVVIGTTTTGTPNVTALGAAAGIAIGDLVTGLDIPAGIFVDDVDDVAHTMHLTGNVTTGHAATPLTFGDPTVQGYLGALVMLYTINTALPQKAPTVASLGEATFGGYSRSSSITWGPTLVNADGDPFKTGDKKQFRATSSVTPNVIQGAAIVASDGTTILRVCPFATPVSCALAGQGLDFVPVLSLVPQS
jgi:hypothetical protein